MVAEIINNERKDSIKKTIDHPISWALKWWELKETILSKNEDKEKVWPNQISISMDKYENKIIKKRWNGL